LRRRRFTPYPKGVTETDKADVLWQQGLDLLARGLNTEAATAFRAAIAADPAHVEAHHGLVRALGDAGQLNQSLSIALQKAGHIDQAEAASARARILEWKQQLLLPREPDFEP